MRVFQSKFGTLEERPISRPTVFSFFGPRPNPSPPPPPTPPPRPPSPPRFLYPPDTPPRIETQFAHDLFQATEHRSSKFPAEIHPPVTRKENHATRLADLVLPTSPNNKKRHETLQRFMLINDSVTVAVEVPVFLTQDDIPYYRSRGFDLDFESDVITGHIDFLQIRNGLHPHPRLQAGCKERNSRPRATDDLCARPGPEDQPAAEILQVRLVR